MLTIIIPEEDMYMDLFETCSSPRSQLKELYELCKLLEVNDVQSYTICTYSPYVIAYLSCIIQAGLYTKDFEIIDRGNKLEKVNGLPDDSNSLNQEFNIVNDLFDLLLDDKNKDILKGLLEHE